jgi:hypothetical protein
LHDGVVTSTHASRVYLFGDIVSVPGGKLLPDLNAAAVPVHIAKAAHIHQDVEAELLSGAKRAQHFVVLAAVPQSKINDLAPNTFSRTLDGLPNLSIRIMAVFIDQRGGELNFEWLFVEQINRGCWSYL